MAEQITVVTTAGRSDAAKKIGSSNRGKVRKAPVSRKFSRTEQSQTLESVWASDGDDVLFLGEKDEGRRECRIYTQKDHRTAFGPRTTADNRKYPILHKSSVDDDTYVTLDQLYEEDRDGFDRRMDRRGLPRKEPNGVFWRHSASVLPDVIIVKHGLDATGEHLVGKWFASADSLERKEELSAWAEANGKDNLYKRQGRTGSYRRLALFSRSTNWSAVADFMVMEGWPRAAVRIDESRYQDIREPHSTEAPQGWLILTKEGDLYVGPDALKKKDPENFAAMMAELGLSPDLAEARQNPGPENLLCNGQYELVGGAAYEELAATLPDDRKLIRLPNQRGRATSNYLMHPEYLDYGKEWVTKTLARAAENRARRVKTQSTAAADAPEPPHLSEKGSAMAKRPNKRRNESDGSRPQQGSRRGLRSGGTAETLHEEGLPSELLGRRPKRPRLDKGKGVDRPQPSARPGPLQPPSQPQPDLPPDPPVDGMARLQEEVAKMREQLAAQELQLRELAAGGPRRDPSRPSPDLSQQQSGRPDPWQSVRDMLAQSQAATAQMMAQSQAATAQMMEQSQAAMERMTAQLAQAQAAPVQPAAAAEVARPGASQRRSYPAPLDGNYPKFQNDGSKQPRKYWSSDNTPIDTSNIQASEFVELYKKGLRKNYEDGGYVFQAGSDYRPVQDRLNQNTTISRSPSPEEVPVFHEDVVRYMIPKSNWEEARQIGAIEEKRRGSSWENNPKLNRVPSLFRVDSADIDRNKFKMYPQVDVATGDVFKPNVYPSQELDTQLTVQENHRARGPRGR